jgi:hypothetical protein
MSNALTAEWAVRNLKAERHMNETLELWSAPWHSLQRNLADRQAAEMSRIIAGIAVAGGAQPGTDAAPSWLARARMPIQPVAGRGP